jgi:hypothetical protein
MPRLEGWKRAPAVSDPDVEDHSHQIPGHRIALLIEARRPDPRDRDPDGTVVADRESVREAVTALNLDTEDPTTDAEGLHVLHLQSVVGRRERREAPGHEGVVVRDPRHAEAESDHGYDQKCDEDP